MHSLQPFGKKSLVFFSLKCFFNVFLIYCLIHWKIIAFSWDNQKQRKEMPRRKYKIISLRCHFYSLKRAHWRALVCIAYCVLSICANDFLVIDQTTQSTVCALWFWTKISDFETKSMLGLSNLQYIKLACVTS